MDKGINRFIKGRLRIAAVMMVCLVAVALLPAVASATWGPGYPGATLHKSPAIVGADWVGAALDARTAAITIGSTVVEAHVTEGTNEGSWTSEEVEVSTGYYRIKWNFGGGDAGAKTTIYGFPAALAAGTYTASVSADLAAGGSTETTFSFTIAANGTPEPEPADGSAATCSEACHFVGSTTAGAFAADYINDNAMGADCASCHSDAFAPGHGVGGTHAIASGTDSGVCTSCHGTDLADLGDGLEIPGHTGCSCHEYANGDPGGHLETVIAAGNAECVDCHAGEHAPHGFEGEASGHSTSLYGFRGMREFYDGSEEATVFDTRDEPIEGEWTIPSDRVFWDPNGVNTPADAYLGEDGLGLTKDSEITCNDCHSGIPAETGDPHGAVVLTNAGIDPDFPQPYKNAVLSYYTQTGASTGNRMPAKSGINYRTSWETTNAADLRIGDGEVICAKCHDIWAENAAGTGDIGGSANTFYGFGVFPHEEHSRDNAQGRGDCVNCHAAIPHGWKRPRLLIQSYTGVVTQNADVVPYGSAMTTVAVTGDAAPYAAPRGYWVAGETDNGFGQPFSTAPGRQGLGLLPAVWGTNVAAGYTVGGPGDHPPMTSVIEGELTEAFTYPEWQEGSSNCNAGCGGSASRHPVTTQGAFIK